MNARTAILQRLRAAPPSAPIDPPDVAAWARSVAQVEDAPARVRRLVEALSAVRTQVVTCTAADWVEQAVRVLRDKGVQRLALGRSAQAQALQAALREHSALQVRVYDQPIERWQSELFDTVDAGFSCARCALADPGALVLWPDALEPRLLSLVPALHLVWLDARQVVADWPSALAEQGWAQGLPTNVVLVSGPSKTADIQQTLAYGAHGPRELVVLLVHQEERA